MKPREIKAGIYWVGAIDWDRRLFDALIPLPDGTSYNSYLISGSEKTALVDTVDPTMQDVLINHLSELGVKSIDYVVANHAEQDHSGTIPQVLGKYPEAKDAMHLAELWKLAVMDGVTAIDKRLSEKTPDKETAPKK